MRAVDLHQLREAVNSFTPENTQAFVLLQLNKQGFPLFYPVGHNGDYAYLFVRFMTFMNELNAGRIELGTHLAPVPDPEPPK